MRNIELEQSNIPGIVLMKSDKAVTKGNNDQVAGLKFLSWRGSLYHSSFCLCSKFPRRLIRLRAAILQFNAAMPDEISPD